MPTGNNNLEKLLRTGRIFVIVLTVFFVILGINALKKTQYIGGDVYPQSTISVTGKGEAFAVADIAEFSFSVTSKESTVDAAQEKSAEALGEILAYLKESGIEERDVKTEYYNVYPVYEWQQETVLCVSFPCPQPPGNQVITGYEASQSVRVKVRNIEDTGTLLGGVGERGATNVSGISFVVDDEDAVKAEARANAIEDAKEKAELLADDLDVKLVRIISFYEDQGYPIYAEGLGGFDTRAELVKAPEIPVGENQTNVTVTITYEIK